MMVTQQYIRRVVAAALAWLLVVGSGEIARASGHAPAHGKAEAEESNDPATTRMLELGDFHLRNFRPTHNETASIRFSVHLVLTKDADPAALSQLVHWKRRLRDQAIVAVRSADAADLAEPALTRVQRLILIRLSRLDVAELIEGVYLTNFLVGDG